MTTELAHVIPLTQHPKRLDISKDTRPILIEGKYRVRFEITVRAIELDKTDAQEARHGDADPPIHELLERLLRLQQGVLKNRDLAGRLMAYEALAQVNESSQVLDAGYVMHPDEVLAAAIPSLSEDDQAFWDEHGTDSALAFPVIYDGLVARIETCVVEELDEVNQWPLNSPLP